MRTDSVKKYVIPNIPYLFMSVGLPKAGHGLPAGRWRGFPP